MDENNKNQNEKEPLSGTEKKKNKRLYGKFLIFVIFILIILESYSYIYLIIIKNLTIKNSKILIPTLTIFIILLLLLIWSFITAMNTNPGDIPLYWGFYIGDDDFKRKRYCLICNAFKPERSHHCSVCNKCVLNMDHHCPWVDNCIGFYNRKFFMQVLFYSCLITLYYDFSAGYFVYLILRKVINKKIKYNFRELYNFGIVFICYVFTLVFSFIITRFFQFHLYLVLNNSTTIESLDTNAEKDKYNIGKYENWIQVFGNNKLLFFFPVISESGRPIGDGLTWKVRLEQSIEINRNNSNEGPNARNSSNDKSNSGHGNLSNNIHIEMNNLNPNININTSPLSPNVNQNK